MDQFLALVGVTFVMAAIFSRFERRIPAPNPILLKCSACGSKLHMRPVGWWRFLDLWAWQIGGWVLVWRLNPPFLIGCLLVLVLVFPWNMAKDRLWHAYWLRKHPLRCQGGGHIAPVPTTS